MGDTQISDEEVEPAATYEITALPAELCGQKLSIRGEGRCLYSRRIERSVAYSIRPLRQI